MAIVKTTVAKSSDIQDAALNLNAKAYEVRRTLAAVWNLRSTGTQPPPPTQSFSLDMKNESGESVVGDGDERVKVDPAHFKPGGKYRSIVKLFIHYEFQKPNSWAMGTGWLVSPDILVTAGHCSYDWSHKMGRADEVKAYIGYYGHQSESDPNVQFRRVKRIVTTEGWVKTKGQKCFDVSFMQLDQPFQGIVPIQFTETPAKGNMELGVVGYPGDLSDKQTGEKGAHMYEMFLKTEWNLATQTDTMLEYQIDTFGGNSGSPVLRGPDLVSIGAHVYGGTFNSASCIGKYGNPYVDFLAAFNLPVPNDGLNLIPVTGNTAINAPMPSGFVGSLPGSMAVSGPAICEVCRTRQVGAPTRNTQTPGTAVSTSSSVAVSLRGSAFPIRSGLSQPLPARAGAVSRQSGTLIKGHMQGADEEGFFDVLKKAASVGAPFLGSVLNTALPVALGPIGGPVGALAGFALNAAGKLCESAEAEGFMDTTPIKREGSMERAVLAEATLSALQAMELPQHVEESIFGDMKDVVMKALPAVKKAAPHVLGAMMEPALRIALDSLHNYNTKGAAGAESFETPTAEPFRPGVLYTQAIDQPVDRQAEAFLSHLKGAMEKNKQESAMDDGSAESFGDFLMAGVRLAGQGVAAVAKAGLPLLVKGLSGAESMEDEPSAEQPHAFSADALAHRAIVAEAALQAVMKQSPQTLQEEGFFDFIVDTVKTVAPIVTKVAPGIISAINPTVGGIVKNVLGQESTMVNGSSVPNAPPATPAPSGRSRLGNTAPQLRSQSSLASLRHEGNAGGNSHEYRGFGQNDGNRRGAFRQGINYSRPYQL